jgi:S1-C subfamily serine protease
MIPVETSVVDHSEADLIIGIDGQKVRTRDDLLSIIEAKKPGDQVVLSLARNGQMAQIPVILGGND